MSIGQTDRADVLIDRHPELARRMDRLDEERSAAAAGMDRAYERLNEARAVKKRAEAELAELRRYHDDRQLFTERRRFDAARGAYVIERAPDEQRLADAEASVEAATARVARAQEAQSAASARWNEASRLHTACERYLDQVGSYSPVEHDAPKRTPEPPSKAVERLRQELSQMRTEAEKVAKAPEPAEELRRRVRTAVTQMAERTAPVVVGRYGVQWPTTLVASQSAPDVMGMFARLFPEKLIALADEAIVDRPGALSDRDRERRLAEIADRLLKIGRDEEALIETAEAGGTAIARRGDADPRAVLGVDGPAPKDP